MSQVREFKSSPAVRGKVPLLVSLFGPSSSGKTYSALRLAKGMQEVLGGDIYGIDTEGKRMLHYADIFKFHHVPFTPPYRSLDYLSAIRHCNKVGGGKGIIIVDSTSHEHDGDGGLLKFHDEEVKRLTPIFKTEGAAGMPAWSQPKQQRRQFIDGVIQLDGMSFIFCFRSKPKLKKVGREFQPQGWMPIAGEEFLYEMALSALLLPGSRGVPTWESADKGTASMIKLPEQFAGMMMTHGTGENKEFRPAKLNEEIGRKLAKWSAGESIASADYFRIRGVVNDATTLEMLDATVPLIKDALEKKLITDDERKYLQSAFGHRRDFIKRPVTVNVDDGDADDSQLEEIKKDAAVQSSQQVEEKPAEADELLAAFEALEAKGETADGFAEDAGTKLAVIKKSKGEARANWAKQIRDFAATLPEPKESLFQ